MPSTNLIWTPNNDKDLALYGSFLAGYLGLLGGSWLAISGVRSLLIWVISIVTLLIDPSITTHDPPSKVDTQTASALALKVF